MTKIAIIGECMLEISGEPFGQSLAQSYGGDTLNTAIYLSRLSTHDVYYVTALGEDKICETLTTAWQNEGIQIDHILSFDHLTVGLYWILLDPMGERSFMYWRKNSAASQLLKHPLIDDHLQQMLSMDWIYLSGISLAILDDQDRQKLLQWLRNYHQQGGKIAFDSNFRPQLWQDLFIVQSTYKEILQLADLALLTDDDENRIWGKSDKALIEHLRNFQCPALILKQGEKGARLIQVDQSDQLIPSTIVDTVADSTAAGDSFNAGVLAGLMNGLALSEACLMGHQIASTVIQHKGAIIPIDCMPHITH